MRVAFSDSAIEDIETIAVGIARYDIAAALKFERGIFDFAASLDLFPNRYPAWSKDKRLRKAVYRKWILLYSVIESRDVVWIERVSY